MDGDIVIWCSNHLAVEHVNGDGRGALIAVSIANGIDEGVRRACWSIAVGVRVVNPVTRGIEGDVAVSALDVDAELARGRRRGI